MKQVLREIIKEWGERELPHVILRSISLQEYTPERLKKVISVIGFRRVGKTYLLFDFIQAKGKGNCIYINFEDERVPEDSKVLTYLSEVIRELTSDRKLILLLDEIQNIPLWSKWIRRMLDTHKYTIFISGSSSKLSSKEISTELRGRSLTVELYPLSFKEFLTFKNQNNVELISESKILSFLREYLEFGGFPEVVLTEKGKKYLLIEEYFQTFLMRDIFERYKIRQKQALKEIIRLLLNSTYFTISKITNTLKSAGFKIGKATVANYINYLRESLFIYPVEIFSYKVKNQIQYPKKIYFVDTFFINRFSTKFSHNLGRLMENCVAIELFRRKFKNPFIEIYYWKDYREREVDFIVKNGKDLELIQVTYVSAGEVIEEREITSLIRASKELNSNNLLIITWDYEAEEKFKGKKIKFIPLWKWLLETGGSR